MFTGIITDVGRVAEIVQQAVGSRLSISTKFDTGTIALGASIACSGACLTVVDKGNGWFAADVSGETLDCTTLGNWVKDTPINLERALTAADELGGHLVLGHVDGVGHLDAVRPEGDNHSVEIKVPENLARFIASKGSVAVDGVSLTVNEVEDCTFGVNIIPHTWDQTSFAFFQPGQAVNLEIDVVARYVARLMERS
ncbi:MAG: riboflavin synthase [Alphaproteobacteria bacterium]|nr:riboflavin synthase [Alphaproteobacteria bacterium]